MEMDRINDDDEEMEDGELRTQTFSVTITWPEDSAEHVDQSELQTAILDEISHLDDEVIVEVLEVIEPAY